MNDQNGTRITRDAVVQIPREGDSREYTVSGFGPGFVWLMASDGSQRRNRQVPVADVVVTGDIIERLLAKRRLMTVLREGLPPEAVVLEVPAALLDGGLDAETVAAELRALAARARAERN